MKLTRPRRRAQRDDTEIVWSTKHRFETGPDLGWRDARLIDISDSGAPLEPLTPTPDETVAGHVELDLVALAPSADPIGASLRGVVASRIRMPFGRIRFGIAFVESSAHDAERLLDLLHQPRE